MAKYRVIFNLIREKARVCSCFARKANEERERERSREWLEANRPSDEKEREDRYGSILIRVFVDTFKSGLAAARRYACHCTRDPSPSSMTSFLAGVNLWRIWRGLFGKREWQRDLLTGMHRSPTVGGRGEGGRGGVETSSVGRGARGEGGRSEICTGELGRILSSCRWLVLIAANSPARN